MDSNVSALANLPDAPVYQDKEVWFAGFRLQADSTLLRDETVVHLPPKELAALKLLLAHAGQVVTPQQLRHELWGNTHVTADSIPKCISSLRARLAPEECIQTVYKRGYRFIAEVREAGETGHLALPRLAIMPFETGPGIARHLGQAVAEEAVSRLTRQRPSVATVLARDSVFTLANRGLTAQQVGEKLKANLVLTGTLRVLPEQYRLRVEMVRIADGAQIWVEDLLVAQTRIAGLEAELVRLLTLRMAVGKISDSAPSLRFVERRKRPERREAYEIFQQARYEWQSLQRHRMQDGLRRLSRATELDPSLIPAQSDFVHACVTQALYGFMAPDVAAGHVHRIADSIPDLAQRAETILPALGWVNFHIDRDLPAALEALSLSAHLPHDPWTTRSRYYVALSRARFDETFSLLRAALDKDPYSPWLHGRLAWSLHLSGQAAESVDSIRNCLSQYPDHDGSLMYGAMIFAYNGEAEKGVQLAHALSQQSPYLDLATGIHAYTLACAGRGDEARSLQEQLQWLARERYVSRALTPATMVALGDLDGALAEVREAHEGRSPWFFQMLVDPRLKPLHDLPEFKELQAVLTEMEAAAIEEAEPEDLDFPAEPMHVLKVNR
jgi:DNA-binding winged helix-turn-helix (wHTH) protein/tetratricopeptide (TPR) repeat protein